jgi:2-oxoglutarate ferredoxin oxidoreductase subunit beta
MNTYGFHTIHGRGAAIATGVKTAKPELNVWLITGDGDCLAIGGNHFIHAVRRNVDINVVLMNNKIYGLTKGQYSPTSERGFISKSSPYGTVEDPFQPAELTIGARGTFFARAIDVDLVNLTNTLVDAAQHRGTSVVEVLVNCVIFNDNIHKNITDKSVRNEKTILLKHGEKMIYGNDNDKGIVLDGLKLKNVNLKDNENAIDNVLTHDAHNPDPTLHLMLANMKNELPVAVGVIRNVTKTTYEQGVHQQIKNVQQQNNAKNLKELLMKGDVWEIK